MVHRNKADKMAPGTERSLYDFLTRETFKAHNTSTTPIVIAINHSVRYSLASTCLVNQLRHPAGLVRSHSTSPTSMTFKTSLGRGHTVSSGTIQACFSPRGLYHNSTYCADFMQALRFTSLPARKSLSRKSPHSIILCFVSGLCGR